MIDHSYGPLQRIPSPRDPVYLLQMLVDKAARPGGPGSAGGDRKNRSHGRLAKARKQPTRQPNINQTSLNKVEVCRMKTALHRFSLDTYE